MNFGLEKVDILIKEKLNSEKINSSLNPFYITQEEIENLIVSDSYHEEFIGLDILSELFKLNDIEKDIISILLAYEIYPKYEKIFSYLQDDLNKKFPTLSLISYLLSEKLKHHYEINLIFSDEFPLLKFGLVKFVENGVETPLIHKPVKLEEPVKNFILGLPSVDKTISKFVNIFPPVKLPEIGNENLKKSIKLSLDKFIFSLYGDNGFDKEKFALNISSLNDYGLFIVNPLLFEDTENFEKNLKNLFRDALLNGCNIYFSAFEKIINSENFNEISSVLKSQIKNFSWIVFFDTKTTFNFYLKDFVFIEKNFKTPEVNEAVNIWKKHINLDDEILKKLSLNFRFNENQIQQVANQIKGKIITDGEVDKKAVYQLCRKLSSKDLDLLAQKLETDFTFDDIVLPEGNLRQLKSIISHYKYHFEVFYRWGFKEKVTNQSISALFTGAPGTGKTMAVSILGNEIGLDVYRIDLSKIVSKYIGETEKNLSRIFDSAENSGVILFFDEADAVFGKRTEIKDAHDRYANIEISYLLQRIEDYKGIVILATNFRKNIDEAFSRRIRFIIDFPFPDEEMRYRIWKKAFPRECPIDKSIDFKYLAKNFKFSGANIKNSALHSAFYGIQDGSKIKMEHILEGIKIELQKIGKNTKEIIKNMEIEEEYEDFL